jgi:hypothetical protein
MKKLNAYIKRAAAKGNGVPPAQRKAISKSKRGAKGASLGARC